MSRLYRVNIGTEPTTAMMPAVSSLAAIHTMLQIGVPAGINIKIKEWGVSMEDFAALKPINVELIDSSAAASTGTSLTPTIWGDPNAPASKCIGGAGLTMFTDGTVTEGTPAGVRTLDAVLLPNTQPFRWQFPLGVEPIVDASRFVRLRVLANAAVLMRGYIIWEE